MLVIVRVLAHVPVPGVDKAALDQVIGANPFLQLLNLFSGGGLADVLDHRPGRESLHQRLDHHAADDGRRAEAPAVAARRRVRAQQDQPVHPVPDGADGRCSSRTAISILLSSQSPGGTPVIPNFDLASLETLTMIATLIAGTILLMWIGELITERGIGNGISFIIFAGIVAQAPSAVVTFLRTPDLAAGIAFGALAIGAVAVIVYIQEGQRRIPIQYASRVRGRRMYQGGATFLPLRVNQAGVIPIIFAVSILLFPVQLATYFQNSIRGRHPGLLAAPSSTCSTSGRRCTSCCTSC